MVKKVFLISGKAGVGKSTSAVHMVGSLQGHSIDAHIVPFARGVKDVAQAMGWDGVKDEKGRKLLQLIGNGGREYDPDVWVSETMANIFLHPGDVFFIDDWRYPNELDYIRNRAEFDVVTIRIYAPDREILKGTPAYDDVSEISLSDNPDDYDYFVENTGNFKALYNQLDDIISKELGV